MKNATLTVIIGIFIIIISDAVFGCRSISTGTCSIHGGFTEGIGVHVLPGWVLADKTVITGHTEVSVSSIDYFDIYADNLRYLAISSQPSSAPQLVWIEVPGLIKFPIARPHSNHFNPGDRLSTYDRRVRRDPTFYQVTQGKDGKETGIERAKGFPITIHLPTMDGPSLADAHPIFDNASYWAGFLIKELPQTELCTPKEKNPLPFPSLCRQGIPEKPWFTNTDLMDKAPSRISYPMKGFPFRSYRKALRGRREELTHASSYGSTTDFFKSLKKIVQLDMEEDVVEFSRVLFQ